MHSRETDATDTGEVRGDRRQGEGPALGRTFETVGATVARAQSAPPAAVGGSLVRRFLLTAVGFAVVVPAIALALPGTLAPVGFVVAAGLLVGTLGFCERYYVLVGTERRLEALAAGEASPKPDACVRGDEVGALLDAVETTVDEYERRVREAEDERDRALHRAEALEARLDDWAARASQTATQVADGDLDRRFGGEDAPAPLADASAALDGMLDELEGTLFNVESFSETAERAAVDAAEAGGEVTRRAERVTGDAERVASRLDRQQRDVERAAGTAADVADRLEDAESDVAEAVEDAAAAVDRIAGAEAALEGVSDGLDEATAAVEAARGDADGVAARADDLAARLDAFDELAEQIGLLALNATLHAARAERRGLPGASRFRTLAGEAVVLADATDDWTEGCRSVLADLHETVDAAGTSLDGAEAAVESARESVADVATATEAVREDAAAARDGVRGAGRSVERLTAPAGHVAGVLDRVVDRNERTAARAADVVSGVESVRESSAGLDDDLGTVRTQAGFLQVQTEGLATRDVEAVRSPGTAAGGD